MIRGALVARVGCAVAIVSAGSVFTIARQIRKRFAEIPYRMERFAPESIVVLAAAVSARASFATAVGVPGARLATASACTSGSFSDGIM
jgi:hypothetical protein